jgi:hypothetical protein
MAEINMTNVEYMVSGQMDVLYNNSVLNVWADPPDGVVHDPVDGDITIDVDKAGIGGNWWDSGRLRMIFDVPWAQQIPGPPLFEGGNGTGPSGNGYLTQLTFRGVGEGTCDIAFWDCATPRQINQIVDWTIYQDYSYDEAIVVWGANASVTVNP